MLKFRAVSPSLTKKVYSLRIAGYNINFIILSQWCKGRFICSLRFSSGLILLVCLKGFKR